MHQFEVSSACNFLAYCDRSGKLKTTKVNSYHLLILTYHVNKIEEFQM